MPHLLASASRSAMSSSSSNAKQGMVASWWWWWWCAAAIMIIIITACGLCVRVRWSACVGRSGHTCAACAASRLAGRATHGAAVTHKDMPASSLSPPAPACGPCRATVMREQVLLLWGDAMLLSGAARSPQALPALRRAHRPSRCPGGCAQPLPSGRPAPSAPIAEFTRLLGFKKFERAGAPPRLTWGSRGVATASGVAQRGACVPAAQVRRQSPLAMGPAAAAPRTPHAGARADCWQRQRKRPQQGVQPQGWHRLALQANSGCAGRLSTAGGGLGRVGAVAAHAV